ncbi:MAG: hypothetical protein DHS20C01_01080 [marine bacterium B5-7]|nr:MAG: hypothetical protein DHS20C01_01080 [marine bacterium B5-7]
MDDRVEQTDFKLGIVNLNPVGNQLLGARGNKLYRVLESNGSIEPVHTFADRINAIHVASSGLYVATDKDHKNPGTPCRLYKSTDGGASFTVVWENTNSSLLWWSITSDQFGNIYIGEYGPKSPGMSKTVWKSTNGGGSWDPVFTAPDREGLHIHRVAVDPYTNDVWVTTGDGKENRGIYRSKDSGKSWNRILDSQATSIAFTPEFVYLGEDHVKNGRVSRYDRNNGHYDEIFNASDYGNYGGSIYDLAVGTNGSLYIPTMKYPDDTHIASLWAGHDDEWKLLLRLKSEIGKGSGFKTITGPDPDGWLYVRGFKIKDR